MGLEFEHTQGQTPLTVESTNGLLIPTIATQSDLDEFEQNNIEEAYLWLQRRSFGMKNILTTDFIMDLHKHMFGEVWKWAGKFRTINTNLGTEHWKIPVSLRILLDDTKYWIEHETFEPDEIAIRFKHKIVSIHCFPNGNGRHSRLMADIIIENIFKLPAFTWGSENLKTGADVRDAYLKAVKEADMNRYNVLLSFARS